MTSVLSLSSKLHEKYGAVSSFIAFNNCGPVIPLLNSPNMAFSEDVDVTLRWRLYSMLLKQLKN
jgi:hypothetical protein